MKRTDGMRRTFKPNTQPVLVGFTTKYTRCVKCMDSGCDDCPCPNCGGSIRVYNWKADKWDCITCSGKGA